MPRDAFSNYTLPAGNPVVTGTIIASSWANTTLNDIATALTNSLSTDGSVASVNLSGKTRNGGFLAGATINTSTANALNLAGTTNVSGGQLQFPASQNPSSNVNTLDDYEEGSFTPSLTFVTPGNLNLTYAIRAGLYTKVGDLVYTAVSILTATFNHTTAAGQLLISGLPFTSLSVANHQVPFSLGQMSGVTAAGFTQQYANLGSSDNRLAFGVYRPDTGVSANLTTTNCASGTQQGVYSSGCYKTS